LTCVRDTREKILYGDIIHVSRITTYDDIPKSNTYSNKKWHLKRELRAHISIHTDIHMYTRINAYRHTPGRTDIHTQINVCIDLSLLYGHLCIETTPIHTHKYIHTYANITMCTMNSAKYLLPCYQRRF